MQGQRRGANDAEVHLVIGGDFAVAVRSITAEPPRPAERSEPLALCVRLSPSHDVGMPWWGFLSSDFQHCGSDMPRLEDGGSIQRAGPGCIFIPNRPQRFARVIPMAEHRCRPIRGIREKRGGFSHERIELTGGREKPREVFLVRNNVSEARRQHFRLS